MSELTANEGEKLRVMDLFSGIGGFSLGLKRAGGFKTVAYCEIEPYCRKVLTARMEDGVLDSAPIYQDVTKLCRRIYDCEQETEDGEVMCPRCDTEFSDCACVGTDQFLDEIGPVDVITGGFPCQDISQIGRREGIAGTRSGLWGEFSRIIRELRPRYVIVENVSALLRRDIGRVLGDLAASGYDAEWESIPASAVGAPHRRDRIFILAHSIGAGLQGHSGDGYREKGWAFQGRPACESGVLPRKDNHWSAEPPVGRVANGISRRMDRLKSLGNAIVPQIATWIGQRILER